MKSRHLYVPARYARTMDEAFRTPRYGAAIERPVPRNMLASRGFWLGALLSLAMWSAIARLLILIFGGK